MLNIKTETDVIVRKNSQFRYYTWYHMKCKNGFTMWTEKDKKEESICPDCGQVIKITDNQN